MNRSSLQISPAVRAAHERTVGQSEGRRRLEEVSVVGVRVGDGGRRREGVKVAAEEPRGGQGDRRRWRGRRRQTRRGGRLEQEDDRGTLFHFPTTTFIAFCVSASS